MLHMLQMNTIFGKLARRILFLLVVGLLAGCFGSKVQSQGADSYVEIPNPAFGASPSTPATIWVPRKSVENGVPRGGELVKQGYEAATGTHQTSTTGTHQTSTTSTLQTATGVSMVTAQQAGITAPGGKSAAFIPRFGLVVAVDGDKVYFNIGREAGITPSQILKVYRGGTVIEGLGLAPGALVATIEVQGFVGTTGGYGLIKQGGQLRINDLVGAE